MCDEAVDNSVAALKLIPLNKLLSYKLINLFLKL